MDRTARMNRAMELAAAAAQFDRDKKYQEALDTYKASLDNWMLIYKYEENKAVKERIFEKMGEYMNRAEEIKKFLSEEKKPQLAVAGGGQPSPRNGGGGGGYPSSNGGGDSTPKDEEKEKMKKALEGAIITEKPNVRWDDVAGLKNAKEALQETVILPTRFPQLFQGKVTPWKGILMYGPPGTGKSFLAKACATEASATFYSISSSDLVSKWMGESERLVKSLFEMAREAKPSIIFIDEVDSMCGSRDAGESDSSRRIKTEFLVQMQGVGHDDTGLLVLGATNTPWDLDSAIRRRFERRIYIPLPEPESRRRMFELNIGDTKNSLTLADVQSLADRTEGYSGADIAIMVRDALYQPVRRCQHATHFARVERNGKQMWTPCSPGAQGAQEMSLMQVPPDELTPPEVNLRDFEAALENSRPSVGVEDIKRCTEWTAQFGMEG
eukprot:gnl/MRDRNA2_/MRDRNA2_82070_c0_seq1.p1 gnl/MRDRNA2_/MRDRNA2_82070_c0~~gnl/MRDRNA2_/MRDRNA2_82070_c0_seq1.p1  ORF type:complete len:469 (-),score=96.45 gnl/MRDRNA2_/MRDRNA2_82070_c0_seq1:8-1327(-)